ncbi:hypothetical protein BE21_52825 [Sorangium cellulosum]|uniref:Uncharacterized protein n=1 Tax=Sorangium cellulosum TaxID=56 RepID=A0A150TF01_SORCE|nr:hypothetical protein BE21_52825 [Sorangium cellulosum]
MVSSSTARRGKETCAATGERRSDGHRPAGGPASAARSRSIEPEASASSPPSYRVSAASALPVVPSSEPLSCASMKRESQAGRSAPRR